MNPPTLKSVDLHGKKVLLRCDLNVPLSKDGKIQDDTRILESLPTIKYLLEKGAKVIILTHLGRPDGKVLENLRVDVIGDRLSELLGFKVIKLNDCIGSDVGVELGTMAGSNVYLLENTRFHPEEEANDPEFAKEIASFGDIFVNDAFGTVHRAHASTAGIAAYLPSCAGLLLEKEITVMTNLLAMPKKPVCLIAGGAKIASKIGVLNNFLPIADFFLIGGALANTFLAANGQDVGSSLFEKDKIPVALKFLQDAAAQNKKVILPVDTVTADMKILDLGVKSVENFIGALKSCATVIWNGPLGLYEEPQFENGTKQIAQFVSGMNALTIIGGGDTIDAIKKFNISLDKFTHVSTGGGAMLEFLEGKELPGIQALIRK